MRYDVIVVGAGAMGSAAAMHLAARGQRVIAFDRFDVPNDHGSSHGLTRIIRIAYYEHPSYVPLLVRAAELWAELERRSGERLFVRTGSIDASAPGDPVFEGSRRSCAIHGLPHEVLTSAELTRRFPAYRLPPDHLGLFQPDGGFLIPETAVAAQARLAAADGASIRSRERVLTWEERGDRVAVKTEHGTYVADHLVLSAGSWMADFLPDYAGLFEPERQVVAWFEIGDASTFVPERFPVFNLTVEEGRYYGFPEWGSPGFKVGRYHHLGERVDPDAVDRGVRDVDIEILHTFARRYFPGGSGRALRSSVCLFTNTPDEHFIMDRLPGHERVHVVSACSGHGFKFASVVGEIVADLVTDGSSKFDLSLFSIRRFERHTA
jgi:sarcosine oxidase